MGRVILPCGNDATTPYCFSSLGIHVYTIEELCYVLKENAFLMDSDIIDKKMVNWIDTECGLKDLATALYPLVHKKGTVSSYVITILEYVGYYDNQALKEVEKMLKQSANLTAYEKMKARMDYMVESNRYAEAIHGYDRLLSKLPEMEQELRANIIYNQGVALTRLFLFERAAGCFKRAYDLSLDKETLIAFLGAKRMSLGDGEYLNFVAEQTEFYEDSLELEHRIENYSQLFETSPEKYEITKLEKWKEENAVRYYEEVDKIINGLKLGYRKSVEE